MTMVQLNKIYKLLDLSDEPYSQTLRSASKNANKVEAISMQGWPYFLPVGLMHVLRSQQQHGRAPRQSVTWITKQDWRSWNYSPTRWTTGHDARFTHTRENSMSRRGIHPLLPGLDRPQRVAPSRRAVLLSGLESAQRKRYLRSEAEESETSTSVLVDHSSR